MVLDIVLRNVGYSAVVYSAVDYSAVGVVVTFKISILGPGVRFPDGAFGFKQQFFYFLNRIIQKLNTTKTILTSSSSLINKYSIAY